MISCDIVSVKDGINEVMGAIPSWNSEIFSVISLPVIRKLPLHNLSDLLTFWVVNISLTSVIVSDIIRQNRDRFAAGVVSNNDLISVHVIYSSTSIVLILNRTIVNFSIGENLQSYKSHEISIDQDQVKSKGWNLFGIKKWVT